MMPVRWNQPAESNRQERTTTRRIQPAGSLDHAPEASPATSPTRRPERARKPQVRDPEMRKLVDAAWSAGWNVEWTRKLHLRFTSPEGHAVYCPGTPSDWRSARNTKAMLRRAGLAV